MGNSATSCRARHASAAPQPLPRARNAAVLGVMLLCCSGQAAGAVDVRSFDLQWNPYHPSGVTITGRIKLDLDLLQVPGALPYADESTLPPWLVDVTITVPGSGPGSGSFGLADYSGLLWNNNNGAISFDFSSELLGQGGWGPSCGPCTFLLRKNSLDPSKALVPYGDTTFQIFSPLAPDSSSPGGQYGGLVSFAPASDPAPSAVPAPLPLAGAAAALQAGRRLRRRQRH